MLPQYLFAPPPLLLLQLIRVFTTHGKGSKGGDDYPHDGEPSGGEDSELDPDTHTATLVALDDIAALPQDPAHGQGEHAATPSGEASDPTREQESLASDSEGESDDLEAGPSV